MGGLGAAQAGRGIRQVDANRDGWLTREEADGQPFLSQSFPQIDQDGDGRVALGELIRAAARTGG